MDMYKRKASQAVSAVMLALSLACGLIPSPQLTPATNQLSPTASLQFTDLFPSEAPTPISTAIPSISQATLVGAGITDSDGKAIIENLSPAANLTVQIEDSSSNAPLEGIQVQALLTDNNSEIVVIALDPNGEYFPLVEALANPVSQTDNTYKALGVSSANAQTGLELTLLMVKIVEWWNTGRSALEFFGNMPNISHYSFWHADYCFTGDQLASYFGFTSGVATALIPIPNVGTPLEKQMLEAVFAISTHVAGQDVENYLRSLPDQYLIRIHRFPTPNFSDPRALVLSLVGLEYLGKCEAQPPAPTASQPTLVPTFVPSNTDTSPTATPQSIFTNPTPTPLPAQPSATPISQICPPPIEDLSFNPSSATVGTIVSVHAKATWNNCFRAMRLKIDGNIVYELGAPEFTYSWNTSGYSAGNHTIRLEVAAQGDNSWSNPSVREATYTLQPGATPTPAPCTAPPIEDLSFNPGSPATVGTTVNVHARATWNNCFRAMRLKIDGNIVYELGAPEFTYSWNTSGYSAGNHTIRLEVAAQGDNSWSNPSVREATYTLQASGGLSKPTLVSPPNGALLPPGTDVTLQWNSVPGATEYLVEIWGGQYGGNHATPCGWTGATSCHIGTMSPGNVLWRVKARDGSGNESPWSDEWNFTPQ